MSQTGYNSGWSLLDRGGRLETLDRDECRRLLATSLRLLDLQQSPQPWPEGRRALVAQLPLTAMTGRRVHPS